MPKIDHPSPHDLTRYLLRTLSPGDLLTVDDHIQGCGHCQRRLSAALEWSRRLEELSRQDARGKHLSYEQLASYMAGRVNASERPAVTGHLEACAICRAELEDLRREMPR
jgi:anti-sigma factor RsiW